MFRQLQQRPAAPIKHRQKPKDLSQWRGSIKKPSPSQPVTNRVLARPAQPEPENGNPMPPFALRENDLAYALCCSYGENLKNIAYVSLCFMALVYLFLPPRSYKSQLIEGLEKQGLFNRTSQCLNPYPQPKLSTDWSPRPS